MKYRSVKQMPLPGNDAVPSNSAQIPRAPKSIKQMDSRWRELCACLDAGEIPGSEKDEWVLKKWGIRRDLRSLYDAKIGLGLQWRWNVAILTLLDVLPNEKPPDGWSRTEYFVIGLGCPRDLAHLGTLDKNEATRLNYLYEVVGNEVLVAKLCERLTSIFGKYYADGLGRRNFSVQDFMVPAHGRDAVVQFQNFLRTGQLPVASSGQLTCKAPPLVASDDRPLEALLQSLQHPHKGQPIQGAYLKGSVHGLCAIAQRIYESIKSQAQDLRPVLLVPCSRQMPPHEYSGLDFLVHRLSLHVFQGDPYCNAGTHSHKETLQQIYRIRKVLSRRPMIVVFIGYEVVQGSSQHLRRAIRDDPLVELLAHLVHPIIGTAEWPVNPEFFECSHFVVLATDQMDILRAYCREDIAFSPIGYKHSEAFVRSYLEFRGMDFGEQERVVAREFQASREVGAAGGLSEAMVAARLLMWRVCAERGAPEPPPVDTLIRYGNVKLLFDALVAQIKRHASALDLLLLRLIALAESGMRNETLWRCAHCWAATLAEFRNDEASRALLAEFENSISRGGMLKRLIQSYGLIVMKGSDPVSSYLDSAAHPYEYPDYPDKAASLPELMATDHAPSDGAGESLDMVYREIREAFVRDLDAEAAATGWPRYLLHQIIAAEALRQQILIQRHEQSINRTAMRIYRRALEALYNGLVSLPPASLVGSVLKGPQPRAMGILPYQPLEAFKFLYGVVYKRMLDGDRTRRVSRKWAADSIKLDIIELAHRAFAPAGRKFGFDHLPTWGTGTPTLPALKELLTEHYVAAAVAARRCGDQQRWREVDQGIQELKSSGTGSEAPSFAVLDRVSFDMHTELDDARAYEMIETCEQRLRALGVEPQIFENIPWFSLSTQEEAPIPAEVEGFIRDTALHLRQEKLTDAARLAEGVDWLTRLADLKYQQTQPYHMAQQHHVPRRGWSDGFKHRLRESFASLLMMMVAARLRQDVFMHSSMSTTPHLSGRGARTLAQAGLETVRALRIYAEDGQKTYLEDWGRNSLLTYLAQEVRRALDWYAVNFANFMPDSVYMLLLEARFSRTVGGVNAKADFLRHRVALDFLNEAEERLIPFHSRPRMRLRFLIERCATVRGLAVLSMDQAEEMQRRGHVAGEVVEHLARARRFIGLAKLDAMQAHHIVSELFGAEGEPTEEAHRDFGNPWHSSVWYQSHRTLTEERRLEGLCGHLDRSHPDTAA